MGGSTIGAATSTSSASRPGNGRERTNPSATPIAAATAVAVSAIWNDRSSGVRSTLREPYRTGSPGRTKPYRFMMARPSGELTNAAKSFATAARAPAPHTTRA